MLSRFEGASGVSEYKYNPFEQRINKSINETNQYFLYDGMKLGANVLSEYDSFTNVKIKYIMHSRRIDTPIASVIPETSPRYYPSGYCFEGIIFESFIQYSDCSGYLAEGNDCTGEYSSESWDKDGNPR